MINMIRLRGGSEVGGLELRDGVFHPHAFGQVKLYVAEHDVVFGNRLGLHVIELGKPLVHLVDRRPVRNADKHGFGNIFGLDGLRLGDYQVLPFLCKTIWLKRCVFGACARFAIRRGRFLRRLLSG